MTELKLQKRQHDLFIVKFFKLRMFKTQFYHLDIKN